MYFYLIKIDEKLIKQFKLKIILLFMKILLLSYNNLKKIEIIKRPSKVCKTPYVGDAIVHDDPEKNEFMIHTPSLGCCGLCEKNSIVYGMQLNNEK